MKKIISTLAIMGTALVVVPNVSAQDEFLFGYSNYGWANSLTVNGTSDLSTGTNQGWWSATDGNFDSNTNYIVGSIGSNSFRNFFTFDISGLSGTVTSATLNLRRYDGASTSLSSNHIYSLYDVTTDATVLNNNAGFSAAIFNDLGSGSLYGSYVITVAGNSTDILNLTLNSAGVADLNSAIGRQSQSFSIGGTLTPSRSVPDGGMTLALLGSALVGLAAFRRRFVK